MTTYKGRVKNAEKTVLNGIEFRSKLESRVYEQLRDWGLNPKYEPKKVVLMEGFYPSTPFHSTVKRKIVSKSKKILDITYTPDFVFNYRGREVWIESKGFKTDTYNLKIKLIRKYIEGKDIVFYELNSDKDIPAMIEHLQENYGDF